MELRVLAYQVESIWVRISRSEAHEHHNLTVMKLLPSGIIVSAIRKLANMV